MLYKFTPKCLSQKSFAPAVSLSFWMVMENLITRFTGQAMWISGSNNVTEIVVEVAQNGPDCPWQGIVAMIVKSSI